MVVRVLINRAFGGFGFSKEFKEILRKNKVTDWSRQNPQVIELFEQFQRDHNVSVRVVTDINRYYDHGADYELVGKGANGPHASLYIFEFDLPYIDWYVREYDGLEWIEYEFPWETLARALLRNDEEDPVLKAVRSGVLKVPER